MSFSRRDILVMGTSAIALSAVTGMPVFASLTDEGIAAFTGGADVAEGGITLTAPEIAENGNTVPISIDAPGAAEIAVWADGNPVPAVATFKFGKLNPTRSAATRIRLAKSQNVVAVAKMEDGSFKMAKAAVKVTIGGCGG